MNRCRDVVVGDEELAQHELLQPVGAGSVDADEGARARHVFHRGEHALGRESIGAVRANECANGAPELGERIGRGTDRRPLGSRRGALRAVEGLGESRRFTLRAGGIGLTAGIRRGPRSDRGIVQLHGTVRNGVARSATTESIEPLRPRAGVYRGRCRNVLSHT